MSDPITQLNKLTSYGRGLLSRLYRVRIWRDQKRPEYFFDQKYKKINQALILKYPEIALEKLGKDIEVYQRNPSEIVNEMLPWFYVFVDVANFLKVALQVLNDFAEKTNPIRFSLFPQLAELYYDLCVIYVQVVILISLFPDASGTEHKKFLSIFGLCHKMSRKKLDDNHQMIVDLFAACDQRNLVKKLREDLKNVSRHVVTGLNDFLSTYPKIRSINVLRTEGTLSLTHNSRNLTQPSTNMLFYEMQMTGKISSWLVYLLLFCPEGITESVIELIKVILREGYFAPVIHNESFYFSKEYINLFKSIKSKELKPHKAIPALKEAKEKGISESGTVHRNTRFYLRHELQSLLSLVRDTPGLLGPKFPLILAALGYAKHEIFVFFRHYNKTVKSKQKPQVFDDVCIPHLIYLIFQLSELINDHQDLIKEYYVEYLKVNALQVKEFASVFQALGKEGTSFIDEFVDLLSNATTDIPVGHFQPIRQKWLTLQYKILLKSNPVNFSKTETILKLNRVIQHTRYVDSFQHILSETSSLRELWYYKDGLKDIFEASIKKGIDQPTPLAPYLAMLGSFPENATSFYPVEQEMIGKEVVSLAQDFIVKIIRRIYELLIEISNVFFSFEKLSSPVNAMQLLHPDKGTTPILPGTESLWVNRHELRTLQLYQRNLIQLFSGLSQFLTFVVYDTSFNPLEYLSELVRDLLRKYCRENIFNQASKEKTLICPSDFVEPIFSFISLLKKIENFVDIDVSSIIQSVMLSEVYSDDLGPSDRGLDWIKKDINTSSGTILNNGNNAPVNTGASTGEEKKTEKPEKLIDHIAEWYEEFITVRFSRGQGAKLVCFSENRLGFVSKRGLNSKPDAYTDFVELQKLCDLIGPYGVKVIDKRLLLWLFNNMKEIESIIKSNKTECEKFSEIYMNEEEVYTLLKSYRQRVPEFDKFIAKSIAIGNVLYFRRCLHASLQQVEKRKIKYLHDCAETAFSQYERNVFMDFNLVPMDSLAIDMGIDVGIADHELRSVLLPFVQKDKSLWQNALPVMYAISILVSDYWKNAKFLPTIEAYDNNINVLVQTISTLIVTFGSLVVSTKNTQEIVDLLTGFVRMTSLFLLRLAKRHSDKQDKLYRDFPSVVVFLDLFVQSCPFVPRSTLDEILPYTLMRSMWRHVYGYQRVK
eukprot:TRINITY_DN7641_c0_g1_i1.p1 TRINITY_DN7641_c0_g1~~TRINITY_DN7641_c0_g1_i1.p1  ORF type:complete len:1170 (-),score=225.67 TRINITY_DN7641_c0_g1_i1:25-3507(-)